VVKAVVYNAKGSTIAADLYLELRLPSSLTRLVNSPSLLKPRASCLRKAVQRGALSEGHAGRYYRPQIWLIEGISHSPPWEPRQLNRPIFDTPQITVSHRYSRSIVEYLYKRIYRLDKSNYAILVLIELTERRRVRILILLMIELHQFFISYLQLTTSQGIQSNEKSCRKVVLNISIIFGRLQTWRNKVSF